MPYRNEPARERRRRNLKERGSLTSMPLDESRRRRLNLENHFGWMVLQKCQVGDGKIPTYPQVVQYHEKPEVEGPEYKKVTYVLYLKGKEDSLGKKEKEVQTTTRNVLLPDELKRTPTVVLEEKEKKEKIVREERPSKDGEKKKGEGKKKKESRDESPGTRKRLIEAFYSSKKRDRSSSGDRIFRPIESDTYMRPEQNPVVVENYTTDYLPPANKKSQKGRNKPKSWQLRSAAGSDGGEVGEGCERSPSREVLWELSSRTN